MKLLSLNFTLLLVSLSETSNVELPNSIPVLVVKSCANNEELQIQNHFLIPGGIQLGSELLGFSLLEQQ